MTREELIRYGRDYYRDLITACCKIDEKHKEFVRESIKALEQEIATEDGAYYKIKALQEQADGDLISRKEAIRIVALYDGISAQIEKLQKLPSVAILPEHDGCKDCKYETYPEYYYPCCECKQNYKDEWQKKPHWNHGVCDNCGYDWGKDAPIASVPNFCPNCGSPMEIER